MAIVVVVGATFVAGWQVGAQRSSSPLIPTPTSSGTAPTAVPRVVVSTPVAAPTTAAASAALAIPTPASAVVVPTVQPTSTSAAAPIQVRDPWDPTSRVWAADSLYALELITADLSAISQGLYVNKHVVDLPPGSFGYVLDRHASRTASLVEITSSNPDQAGRWYVPADYVLSR